MAGFLPDDFRFYYRSEQGRITRAQWMRGALPLIIALAPLTLVLREALAYTNRPLSERAFYEGSAFAAHTYILFYVLVMLLITISWVNLGAKRFRDRGRPAPLGLAGLLPLSLFLAGAAHWLQPRIADVMARWSVTAFDFLALATLVWTLAEMFDALPAERRS